MENREINKLIDKSYWENVYLVHNTLWLDLNFFSPCKPYVAP